MICKKEREEFECKIHKVDFCVVGGGLAGMLAAISAARHGIKVALMQDRPMLGGNASSEIRMWVRGARGANKKETGILEELALENIYRNPTLNFFVWDTIMYEKVRFEENIDLILNCSCCEAVMDSNKILKIKGWQTTTQKWHEVEATLFADCSGDSVLAPLTGAEYRMGRESSEEFGETIAPKISDNCTMGLTCQIQARETAKPVQFIAPKWAPKYTKENFINKLKDPKIQKWHMGNLWWMEIGGVYNSIDDTETLRDELLKIAYGSWNYIKNGTDHEHDAENWELDWVGFLPGKRESRRYVGDHILTQSDVQSGGRFEDLIAYGGWSIDDHNPKGFETTEPATIHHTVPSPFGIPYRVLYSKNIDNLTFAGRNISATHTAMASSRVMATCAILGQALGAAAYLAIENRMTPREVYQKKIYDLQQILMDDDCYLPYNIRKIPEVMDYATIKVKSGDASCLIDGIERPIDEVDHAWEGNVGDEITISFEQPKYIKNMRIVFDSDLTRSTWTDICNAHKQFPMKNNTYLDEKLLYVPKTITKMFKIFIKKEKSEWQEFFVEKENHQRLVNVIINETCKEIKLVPMTTWGYETVRIYSLDVND